MEQISQDIADFRDGKKTISDMSPEARSALLEGRIPDELQVAPEAAPAPAEPAVPAETAPAPAEKPPFEKPKSRDKKELRRIAMERANELNTLKQKEAVHEQKMKNDPTYRAKYFASLGLDYREPTVAPSDPFDVDYQKSRHDELEQLRRTVSEQQAYFKQLELEKEAEKTYKTVESFARQVGLEVDGGVYEMDKAVQSLKAMHGREPTDADLAEAGYDETDISNFRRLVKVQHFQTLNGYPTLRSAWADMPESAKGATAAKQTQQATGAELDDPTGREARKAQMRRAMSAPTTMPTQRGGSEAVAIKPEQALEWLRTHKNQAEWSDHDRKTFAKIRVVLGMA
jgi:hypothetical protein